MNHQGSCHCGAVRFRFQSEPLTGGIRCNCSICSRRGCLMSREYLALDELVGQPALYQWGDHMVKFWHCNICGIHTFSEVEGRGYRINLGCVEGVDVFSLPFTVIDGRAF